MVVLGDRVVAARYLQDRGVVQKAGEFPGLQGSAHDQNPLFPLAQDTLIKIASNKPDQNLLVEVPFVYLIENEGVIMAMSGDLFQHLDAVGDVA